MTPVHLAAREGYEDILEGLPRHQAKIDEMDDDGNSPLHLAARAGCSATVRILRETEPKRYHSDIDAKDKLNKETPLHIAAQRGSRGVTEALL
ncbi:ankyrin repeat protein, partial [Xylaria flabelliformis]